MSQTRQELLLQCVKTFERLIVEILLPQFGPDVLLGVELW